MYEPGDRVKIRIEVETTVLDVDNQGVKVEIPHLGGWRYVGQIVEIVENLPDPETGRIRRGL